MIANRNYFKFGVKKARKSQFDDFCFVYDENKNHLTRVSGNKGEEIEG